MGCDLLTSSSKIVCGTAPRFCLFSSPSRQFSPFSADSAKSHRRVVIVARAGPSHCEPSSSSGFSGLNGPIELKSTAGLFLRGIFLNQRHEFDHAVVDELTHLSDERDDAQSRLFLCSNPDESLLHRRIAEVKELETQKAVQDIIYMLIFSKFSDIHVPLVPKLSRCIFNGRLEIMRSKDWELESIHSIEVLEMIKEHILAVIGLKINSGVTDHWATTEIRRQKLGILYLDAVLYGYFLKSATCRHHLDRCLYEGGKRVRLPNLVFNKMLYSSNEEQSGDLRSYVLGFDHESLMRCARVRSREACHIMENQRNGLFWEKGGSDEVIVTSFGTMKRLILEAFAFGSFLWDAEDLVNMYFRLEEI